MELPVVSLSVVAVAVGLLAACAPGGQEEASAAPGRTVGAAESTADGARSLATDDVSLGARAPAGLEYVPPAPGTYSLPPIQEATEGTVLDADGTSRRLLDYMGDRLVLLSFIYTRCTDAEGCPYATANLQLIEEGLAAEPGLSKQVRLITLSFDPRRDTPEALLRYAARDYLDTPLSERPWVFLTSAAWSDIEPILDGYGQYVVREFDAEGNETGKFSHVLKVFLIDRSLRVRNIYSTSFLHPALAINDLKTLLMEEQGAAS